MRNSFKQIGTALMLGMGAAVSAQAAGLDLSIPNYVTYGDANSYSLPILATIYDVNHGGTGNNIGPGNPYYIPSSPGAIKDMIVVATGADGQPVNTNFAGMDNAYPTPNGAGGAPFFSTGTTADPGQVGGAFIGDQANTWDTTLSAFKGFLGGGTPVFFFNNNQTNSGDASNQNLAAWARITITEATILGVTTLGTWDFTNNGGKFALVTEGGGGQFLGDPGAYNSTTYDPTGAGPIAGTNESTDYVLSGGQICLNLSFVPVKCNGTDPLGPVAYGPINHNLGANQAAYAEVFPELNAKLVDLFALSDLTGYAMHIDLRMGCALASPTDPNCVGRSLNNGYEQLFIASTTNVPTIPEPATPALMALGFLGLVWINRRRPATIRIRLNK